MANPPFSLKNFYANIIPDERGCWVWIGERIKGGYGRLRSGHRKRWMAHRWSYTQFIGPIPDGLTIDHVCRNTSCVNPTHLDAVTMRENLVRGTGFVAVNAAKTQCIRGHAFDETNTRTTRAGTRQCRTCETARLKVYNQRRGPRRRKETVHA